MSRPLALRTSALLLMLVAAPATALEFRRVGELHLGSGGLREWLDPHRYVRLKNEWERAPGGAIRGVTFVVADVLEQKLLRLPFALADFQGSHAALFTGPPNVELVHFDGTSGLLRFDRREPMRTVSSYSVWDPKTQALTEPRQMGEALFTPEGGGRRVSRLTYLVGPDPAASRLIFADVTYDDRPGIKPGPVAIHFRRVTFPELRPDGEVELALPRRKRQLGAEVHRTFSFDGTKLALAEYHDSGAPREFQPVPPPQVYVIDFERRSVARYPIPRTPYGLAFSRDGRYLAVGGHEEAEIIRIDLQAGRIDRRVKAPSHLQAFATTASGDSLIVLSDHLGAPRSIEVRRWSDLGLRETIPVSRLFPGLAGLHPSGIRATPDGRHLVAPRYAADGYPDRADAGLVTFAIEEGTTIARPDPVALVRRHMERSGVRLYGYQLDQTGNTAGYFAPIVANHEGESFAIGTRSDLAEDAPFQAGRSQPYAIWVDAKGQVVWERSLRSGTNFLDYEGGSAVATVDGHFIAFMLCYVTPSAGAAARVVKLDRKGRAVWEWTSPLGKDARFPEKLRLLSPGTILMNGHLGTSTTPWVGELDATTGQLLRDEVGGPR